MMMICLPLASRIREDSFVVRARPPITLPALMLRKKSHSFALVIRMRSPTAPSAEGVAGIDSNDAYGIMVVAKQLHQFVNNGAFPRTWRACNTDIVSAPEWGYIFPVCMV